MTLRGKTLLRMVALIGVLGLFGCDGDDGTDAGPTGTDAGPGDIDAGPGGTDAGPGDTDAGPGDTDAGPGDADAGPGDADAGPGDTDAGMMGGAAHCAATDLIIEEVDPGTGITLFNPTGAPIDTSSGYRFCQRPSYPTLASIEGGVTIAAGARHTFAWPGTFADTDAGGEIALYTSGSFNDAAAQIDFVCWGLGHTPSRKSVAESDGDWVGDCAAVISGGSLRRSADTDGAGAASYDETGAAAALTCP